MNIGLFFGTYNPIHLGHVMIADYLASYTDLDEIYFVVSPQSPFKQQAQMLHARTRLHLVNLTIQGDLRFRACDIEFDMPRPSYTIDTLIYLEEKYPNKKFSLIMGEDNLRHLHKWKNAEKILENHKIYVYPRSGSDAVKNWKSEIDAGRIQVTDTPKMEISSSMIRRSFKEAKPLRHFLHPDVFAYIRDMHYYE